MKKKLPRRVERLEEILLSEQVVAGEVCKVRCETCGEELERQPRCEFMHKQHPSYVRDARLPRCQKIISEIQSYEGTPVYSSLTKCWRLRRGFSVRATFKGRSKLN